MRNLFLIGIILFFGACAKCKETLLLDLIMVSATPTSSMTNVGQPFTIEVVIKNEVLDTKNSSDCPNTIAHAPKVCVGVQYRQNENSAWQDAVFSENGVYRRKNYIQFKDMPANQESKEVIEFEFQSSGHYRFLFGVDCEDLIRERNETNNGCRNEPNFISAPINPKIKIVEIEVSGKNTLPESTQKPIIVYYIPQK